MKINKDFALAWRAGYKIEKRQYRNEQVSGHILCACFGLSILLVLGAVIFR